MLRITPNDGITLEQCFSGVLALGGTGSGKTSTFAHLMRALMERGCGFLILTSKSTDIDDVQKAARQAGREADIREVAPGREGSRFNFLDYEINAMSGGKRVGSVASTSQLLADLVEFSIKMGSQGGNEPFWPLASARQLRMCMNVLTEAIDRVSVESLYSMATSLPTSREAIQTQEWQASFCAKALISATKGERTPDLQMAVDYIANEVGGLGDRTGMSIRANTINTLERFMSGDLRELIACAESDITPDDVMAGKIVVINTPALVYQTPGTFTQLVWKLCTVRAALRRQLTPESKPVVAWIDEAQNHAVPTFDSMTQAVARSHKLINVALTQNLNLLEAVVGSKEQAKAWVANMTTKLLFANTDSETNRYFSELLGDSRQLLFSGSNPHGDVDLIGDWLGTSEDHGSTSFTEHMLPEVPPGEFMKLRKGGRQYGFLVDAIVIRVPAQ